MYFVSLWYRQSSRNLQVNLFYQSFHKNDNRKFVVVRTNKRINENQRNLLDIFQKQMFHFKHFKLLYFCSKAFS